MSERTDQVVHLNNCEVLIESLSSKVRGSFYLVWKKGKKSTQSSKYQFTADDALSPKELLTLSLKVYQVANAPLPRHTHLILFTGAGEPVDRTKLMIQEWTGEFREIVLALGPVAVKIRVKRRAIMKLEKFHRLRSEVEETSEDEGGRFKKKASTQQGENQRQELVRLTKQIEDQGYMIDRLREQRTTALVRVQNLQEQLGKVQQRMRKDLSKLREYSQLRMQMRESIYKEQIQHLITSFNRNYELNHGLLEGLIKEKYEYEREIEDLKQSNQEYITHQQANFERIVAEMEAHKKEVDEELQDSNEKLKERERTITELNDTLDALNAELQQLKDANRVILAEKEREFADFTQQVNERDMKIAEYEDIIEADKLSIQNLTQQLSHKQTELFQLNKLYDDSLTQKTEISKLNLALNEEKEHLMTENLIMNNELVKLRQEVEEQNDVINKLKEQYELNTNELMKELESREIGFAKDLQALRNENLLLHARNQQGNNQAQLLRLQLEEANDRQKGREVEIELYKKQLENQKAMYEHLLKENAESLDHFKSIQAELNEKLGMFISRNTELEIENTQLKGDLRQLSYKSNEELDRIRDEYQKMMQSNKKLYDDELDLLRSQREDEVSQFQTMRTQYQHQIASMMEHQKAEIDDLDHLYREEIELKTREYVELMQKNAKVIEEFEDYKMAVGLEKAQRGEEGRSARKGKMPKRWAAERIAEEEDEDEPIETVEVQSEEEEDEEPLIVGRRLKSKKKPSPEPVQEEMFEEIGEEEEEQGKSESIVGMFKQKRTRRSKLKKGGKISLRDLDEEEEEEKEKEQPKPTKKGKDKVVQEAVEEEHSQSNKKSSEVENVEVFSEPQPQPQPQRKPKAKPKLEKKVSRKPAIQQCSFTEQQFQQLKAQKQCLQQRVGQLQKQLATAKKEERKGRDRFEKEERRYQGRIKALEDEVEELNKEIADLNAAVGDRDGKGQEIAKKLAEARRKEANAEAQRRETMRELQQQRMARNELKVQEVPSPKSVKSKGKKQDHQHSPRADPEQKRKPSTAHKEVNQQKYLDRIQQLEQAIREKERRIVRLDQQNKDLSREVQRTLAEGMQRQQMLESRYQEVQRRQMPLPTPGLTSYPLQLSSVDHNLKASLANLEQRVSSEREKYHQAKLRLEGKSRECEAVQGELRKARQRVDELEERIKKQAVPRSIQELQSEIDDGNRKILELARTVNQARLERDSFEDETRILKKKLSESVKTGQEWQSRAGEGERELDDLRRKEQRWKRESEEWRQEEKRLKELLRRGAEELCEVRKAQSEFVIERKKVLDEVVRLEGALAQKEAEAGKLSREVEKVRGKMSEETQGRTGKQRELRTEFQRLEIERSKAERKARELEQTVKLLKQKLEAAQKQSKRGLQQRKQTYGQKLRRYIEEIMAVKKVVEEYQQENSHLKIQNSEFFEQNEILKMSYEKLEIKLEEMGQHEETLRSEIAAQQQKIASVEDALKRKTEEQAKATGLISTIRKQLDNERVASRKKTQKLQSYEQINERYLYQIKNLKLKLNDFQTCAQDAQKLTEQIYASQRTIDSLQEQLHKVTEQYQSHSTRFVYTREQVEAALRDLREHELQVKEEEVGRVVAELDEAHASGRSNMEAELLALYAENEKLRVALQKATEDAVEFQQQLGELESLRERNRGVEKQRGMLQRRVGELTDELQASREENRRLEVRFNESVRSQEGKATENALLLQKNDELSRRLREVSQGYSELKVEDRRLLEKYKMTVDEKDALIEKMQGELQGFSNKLLADELEIRRLKELQKISSDDSIKKIRKLQSRAQQLTSSHQQSLRQLQSRSKSQIKELRGTIARYQQQLQDKLHRIEQLNEGVLMLQSEVQQLTAELTAARDQLAEEGELYTMEINKLRNSMREMETAYDENLRNLEEELSAMSKELTAIKFSREAGNSRLRGSRQSDGGGGGGGGEDRAGRRFEEKLKLKDRRIEELKETVLVLEQKLSMQVRSVESRGGEATSVGVDQLRAKMAELQKDHKEATEKKDAELSRLSEQLKRVKEQLFQVKGREQQLTLTIQQKDFEINACSAELAMVSRLYNDLQREVEGRKESLDLQMRQETAVKMELEAKIREIASKNEQIAVLEGRSEEYEGVIKKRNAENRALAQQVDDLAKERSELMSAERKKLQGESLAKIKIKQLQKDIQATKGENRKLRNELSLSLKQCDSLKSDLIQKNTALSDLLQEVQANDRKIGDSQKLIERYIALNELSLVQFNTPLDGLLALCTELRGQAQSSGEELAVLTEQHEQLKFLYERKFLDLQQAKRENYELVLRVQQRQLSFQELDALHERVVRLQQENKELAFRQEAVRVQLEGVYAQGTDGQVRERVREILEDRYV